MKGKKKTKIHHFKQQRENSQNVAQQVTCYMTIHVIQLMYMIRKKTVKVQRGMEIQFQQIKYINKPTIQNLQTALLRKYVGEGF